MHVVSPKACSPFNVQNMGALCCDGADACKRSNFQFNGENKCGLADVCCRGPRACESSVFTGVRNMACHGSCRGATVSMTGDLVVANGFVADQSRFTWTTGGSHCIRTMGVGFTMLASNTLTFEQPSNIQMDCTGGNGGSCGVTTVHLSGGSCLHVICGGDGSSSSQFRCNNFKVGALPNAPDDLNFECYCTGGRNCNWIDSFQTEDGTKCKRTIDANPNPCALASIVAVYLQQVTS